MSGTDILILILMLLTAGGIVAGVICWCKWIVKRADKKKQDRFAMKIATLSINLDYINVIGTRTAIQGNVNFPMYTLLLVYKDGSRRTEEVEQEIMDALSGYIKA